MSSTKSIRLPADHVAVRVEQVHAAIAAQVAKFPANMGADYRVPEGKVFLAECHQVESLARERIIREGMKGRTTYRLIHCPRGWYPAGSVLRYQDRETWLFRYVLADGTRGGQHYRTEAEASARFTSALEG